MKLPFDRLDRLDDGEQRKRDAHKTLEKYRALIIEQFRRRFLCILLEHGTATIDDVRELMELPTGMDATCLGAVPGPLARAGIIRRVGYVKSERADAHARPISVWELLDSHAVVEWIRSHPTDLGLSEDHPPTETE
ncbi:MAG: hypothetical protein KDA52_05465 [Planctomycetaceae bacterium]|nr:hypothetical protein [Planctomycetaceae bacterium]